jgi:hypothetical protein
MPNAVHAIVLLFLTAIQTSAHAGSCDDQKGSVIFEDDFADDTGGWVHPAEPSWSADYGKSGLTLRIHDPSTSFRFLNLTFAASEGDFCVEAVMPKWPSADTVARVGLVFLANDFANFYVLMAGGDLAAASSQQQSMIGLMRLDDGNWGALGTWSEPKIKLGPESVVALRAVVKAKLITVSANGVELRKVRFPGVGNNLKFGVYVETSRPVPAPGISFQFKRYRVTAGE